MYIEKYKQPTHAKGAIFRLQMYGIITNLVKTALQAFLQSLSFWQFRQIKWGRIA